MVKPGIAIDVEKLRKKGKYLPRYLTQMVRYTKQGDRDRTLEVYRKVEDLVFYEGPNMPEGLWHSLERINDKLGHPDYTREVAEVADKVLESYKKTIDREARSLGQLQKRLESDEAKFKKLRNEVEAEAKKKTK